MNTELETSFERLPYEVVRIRHLVEETKAEITQLREELSAVPKKDLVFSLNEVCNYLPGKPSRQTVYGYTSKKIIPHHKMGKRLIFFQSELDQWLKNGKPIERQDPAEFLKKRRV